MENSFRIKKQIFFPGIRVSFFLLIFHKKSIQIPKCCFIICKLSFLDKFIEIENIKNMMIPHCFEFELALVIFNLIYSALNECVVNRKFVQTVGM